MKKIKDIIRVIVGCMFLVLLIIGVATGSLLLLLLLPIMVLCYIIFDIITSLIDLKKKKEI